MTKSEKRRELVQARERADLARMRFGNAARNAIQRIAPERLKTDAINTARDTLDEARQVFSRRIRQWPFALGTTAVGASAVAMIFSPPARVAGRYLFRAARFAWAARFLWRRIK